MVHCRKCHIFVRLSAQNVVLIFSSEEKHNLRKKGKKDNKGNTKRNTTCTKKGKKEEKHKENTKKNTTCTKKRINVDNFIKNVLVFKMTLKSRDPFVCLLCYFQK